MRRPDAKRAVPHQRATNRALTLPSLDPSPQPHTPTSHSGWMKAAPQVIAVAWRCARDPLPSEVVRSGAWYVRRTRGSGRRPQSAAKRASRRRRSMFCPGRAAARRARMPSSWIMRGAALATSGSCCSSRSVICRRAAGRALQVIAARARAGSSRRSGRSALERWWPAARARPPAMHGSSRSLPRRRLAWELRRCAPCRYTNVPGLD